METQNQNQNQEQKAPKASPVDPVKYEKYTTLKFLKLDGATLRDDAEQEVIALEKELKGCKGSKPKKTVTASIGLKIYKLVEGIPVPGEMFKEIEQTGKSEYYF